MIRTTIGRHASAILLGLLVGVMAPARADTIRYTETFTASGSLGGASFTDQQVTLTAYGDTSTLFQTPAVAFVDAPHVIRRGHRPGDGLVHGHPGCLRCL